MKSASEVVAEERKRHRRRGHPLCGCGVDWSPWGQWSKHVDEAVIAALSDALDEAGGGGKFAVGDRVRWGDHGNFGVVVGVLAVKWDGFNEIPMPLTQSEVECLRPAPPRPPTLLEAAEAMVARGITAMATADDMGALRALAVAVARERAGQQP